MGDIIDVSYSRLFFGGVEVGNFDPVKLAGPDTAGGSVIIIAIHYLIEIFKRELSKLVDLDFFFL